MKRNYYPLINVEYIKEFSDENGMIIYDGEQPKPIEPFIVEYRKDTETIIHNEKKRISSNAKRIKEFIKRNKNVITDFDTKAFNKILGDRQILSKLVFVTDGSWRNNRIYFHYLNSTGNDGLFIEFNPNPYDKNSIECAVFPCIRNNSKEYKKALNFIKSKYELIFIQLVEYTPNTYDYEYDYLDDELEAEENEEFEEKWEIAARNDNDMASSEPNFSGM